MIDLIWGEDWIRSVGVPVWVLGIRSTGGGFRKTKWVDDVKTRGTCTTDLRGSILN